jgi:four helix bundle protein
MGKKGIAEDGAYRKAFRLALSAHIVTRGFPEEERRAFVPDILESAIAIPVSISNGLRLRKKKDILDHLYVAVGKCARLESQLALAYDLKYIPKKDYVSICVLLDDTQGLVVDLITELEQ